MILGQHQTPLAPGPKWGAPAISRIDARERLLGRLDQASSFPCTWIAAPAGYGKTCLASAYVERATVPALWYTLERSDSDAATFFADVSGGLRAMMADVPLLQYSADVQDPAVFARAYFKRVFAHLPGPHLLVLDDYHELAPEAALHAVVAALIGALPPGTRLIVLSREAPPAALARAQTYDLVARLGADDLRLTLEEGVAIAGARAAGGAIEETAVQSLLERSDGWAAGFVLLLRSPARNLPPPETTTLLFAYFAQEVLRSADEDTRRFLLRTAWLPSMTAEMAERMTDHPRAAALLHSLLQGNYFLSRTDAPDPLYRYHQLFRLFLLHHTGTVWGAEEQAECRRQAAAILEEEGQLDAAAALWREAGDWDALVSLIRRAAPLRLAQGLTQGLDTWMEGVPSLAAAERPWLLYWLGRARLHPDPIAARSLFEQAYRGFKQAQDIEGGLLSWAGVCETYWIALDGTDPLTRWLAELEDLQSQWQQFPSPEIEARVSFGAFFAVIANDPLHPRRSLWEKRLLSALDSTLPPDLRLMVANLLMFHYVWTMGDRGRAALVLDRLRVLAGNDATAPLSVIIARTWGDFAYEYCFGGQMERCRTIAKGAMAVAAERGAHLYDAILWAIPACAYLTTAQFAKAQPYLSKILGTVDAARLFDRGLFFYLRAWEAWLDDRLAEAREAAETSLAYAGRFGDLHGYWHTKLALAQIEQTSGNTRRALRHLAAVRHWARRVGSALAVFTGALVLARLALESERPERCRRLLRIAFGLGRQQGYVSILFFEPETLARLCAHALDAGMDVDYTRLLIRQRDLAPPREALVSEWWPWPIKIATLGGLALWVNEDAIRWPRKAQHKPLDLLRAVIAYGGRRVPSEKLIDELWPEAEGDAATRALKTTLHRVRKLLGREDAVQLRDGQVSLNPACVWLDRWALEQVLEDTRLAASRPPRVGMLEAIEKTSQARMALT